MKTCYIYLRVSTEEQASEGFSIENQKRSCVDYAKNHGFNIKKIYTEDGKSARTTDRPVFQEMLSFAKEKPVDAIIFYKIDRLFRNVADFSTIRKELKSYGN
jgi:site-specific DNA recombinase